MLTKRENIGIVIPVWKENLTEFEEVSLLQCCFILKKYTFCIITWSGLDLSRYISILENGSIKFRVLFFNKRFFLNIVTYNRLMLSVDFYIRLIFFKYILIYQLDCFVFRDEIALWIRSGYSYIGAPWLQGYSLAKYGASVIGVGNGGLSLRCVVDHLRVLLSFSYIKYPFSEKNISNKYNEDIFWGCVSRKKIWFKIPDWKIAVKFSIEVQPRYFFELNNKELPFGCHAWWRYDLDFWKPYIENFGHIICAR